MDEDFEDEEVLYTVEKILDFKQNQHGKFYKLKWLGYPESEANWEHEDQLAMPKKKTFSDS